MQNKTKTYILLAFVIGIWGIIGFKIVSTINPEPPEAILQNEMVVFHPKTKAEVDTFSIQSTERDPFLGTLHTKTKRKTKTVKSSEDFSWPTIKYHGSVTQQASKNKVFVISVKEQQHILKIGQHVDGLTLVKGNTNEIKVSYKNRRKNISKT